MARRSSQSESSEVFDNVLESLAKGTDFKLSSNSNVLTERPKVRTPIEALNCILGGGLPFGTVAQSYGPPKVGKSTWMYQMLGIFQKTYPNGVAMVIDMEASADGERISYLGVDTSKLLRLPATSIESGFLQLMKVLENKQQSDQLKDVPVFVIWDTISKGLAQDSSTQSRLNAMDRARIIKNYMSPVMAQIEKQDFILCLLNQVIYKTDNYGNQKMDSGGGIALKHDVHFSTRITPAGDEWNGNFKIKTKSAICIDKSKLGPEMSNIPMIIDNQEGGIIDEVRSFFDYVLNLGFINNSKGWYNFNDLLSREQLNPFYFIIANRNKSYRYDDILRLFREDKLIYNIFRYLLMEFLASMFKLQAKVMSSYKSECLAEIRRDYDPPELYLQDNEDKISEVLENLKKNNTTYSILLENLDNAEDKAICLDCGAIIDNLSPCNQCGSNLVVTRDTAKKLIDRLNSDNSNNDINVDTEKENSDEEITE